MIRTTRSKPTARPRPQPAGTAELDKLRAHTEKARSIVRNSPSTTRVQFALARYGSAGVAEVASDKYFFADARAASARVERDAAGFDLPGELGSGSTSFIITQNVANKIRKGLKIPNAALVDFDVR